MSTLKPAAAILATFLGAGGCKPEPPPPKPAPPPSEKPAAVAGKKHVKKLWMVPHPSEIMQVMRSMDLAGKTSALVPIVAVDFKPMDGQRVAFNTGLLVADLVLSLEDAKGPELSTRLNNIRQGLAELGMGETQLGEMDKLSRRLAAGKTTSEELAAELDVLQGRLMDDVSQYSSPDALMGIQAGAWLRAVNVVATLLLNTGKAAEGAHLFAQPDLVEHFSTYLKKNQDKAVDNPALEASLPYLAELKKIASKPELTAADVDAVQKATGSILREFRAAGRKP
jgi:hypothetical protein